MRLELFSSLSRKVYDQISLCSILNLFPALRLNFERELGGCVCFAVVDPNKDKKAKAGRGRFSVTANGEESKLVPANYVLDGEFKFGDKVQNSCNLTVLSSAFGIPHSPTQWGHHVSTRSLTSNIKIRSSMPILQALGERFGAPTTSSS